MASTPYVRLFGLDKEDTTPWDHRSYRVSVWLMIGWTMHVHFSIIPCEQHDFKMKHRLAVNCYSSELATNFNYSQCMGIFIFQIPCKNLSCAGQTRNCKTDKHFVAYLSDGSQLIVFVQNAHLLESRIEFQTAVQTFSVYKCKLPLRPLMLSYRMWLLLALQCCMPADDFDTQ